MASFAVFRRALLSTAGMCAISATAMAQTAPEPVPAEPAPVDVDVDVDVEPAPVEPAPMGAEPAPMQPTPMQPTYEPAALEPQLEEPGTDMLGIAVSLGGGVAGFTNDIMRDTTNDGGAWGVRAAIGLRSYIGLEAAYMGSAQSIDALGLDNDAVLVGNGVQGALRLNVLPQQAFQPFLFGGLAWRHYNLTNEGFNTSDIAGDDDVLEVPVGVGIAWTYRGLLLDARGEFRYSEYEDMVPDDDIGADGASMNRWGVNANIGYAF